MSAARASIIIVTLEGRKHLEPLLTSLFEGNIDVSDIEILVVDNASERGTATFIEDNFPRARTLELHKNYGFAPAVNLGAVETNGEYIVLLNDDCIVRDNWLDELLKPFDANPAIACVGSLILDETGKEIDFQTGSANIFGWGFHMDEGRLSESARDKPFRTFFACGAACAFKRGIFEKVGMLLEETFAYFEDVEMGWRLNALGYEVWMNPASVVEHQHGATVKRFGPGFHVFLTERNALLNAWCNLSPEECDVVIPIATSLSALRIAARAGSNPEFALGRAGLNSIFSAREERIYHPTANESLRSILKMKRFGRDIDWAPIEALADFSSLLPLAKDRRDSLNRNRKCSTLELLPLMEEPFRPVIGHPREKKFIEEMEPVIREALRS